MNSFVIMPDPNHHRCFLPYLFVVLNKGYTVDDVREQILDCLEEYMHPENYSASGAAILPFQDKSYWSCT